MKKKKMSKNIASVLVIVLVVTLGLWVIIVYPLIKFHSNESTLKKAGERYFQINANRLPSEGELVTLEGITLLDKSYISESLRSAYNGSECNMRNSWVKVKKESGDYKYYTYLECGLMKSSVDHKGPDIKLNGKDEIEVERGEKFEDPGIKSVRDNTDGKINPENVTVKSDLDTSQIGEYTITYSAIDSFQNKSVVTRKVKVTQSLKQTILNATDNDGTYRGDVNNNYIRFSGQLFRIVNLNKDGTVKIVSNDNISQVDYNSLDNWLNEYYYNHLAEESKKYIATKTSWCSDTVKKEEVDKKVDCKEQKNKKNIGLLSVNEYNSSLKEGESYLYTDSINWTSSSKSSTMAWTTTVVFLGQDSKYLDYNKREHFNIRPSVVLKKDIKIIDGDGTINDPYDIGDFKTGKAGEKINTRYSGEYINYSGIDYRIIEVEDGYTKVTSVNDFSADSYEYGGGSAYNPNKKDNIGYTLENNVSKYMKTSLFAKHTITVPIYENRSSYNGKKTEKKYEVKFSAPNLYDMYSASMTPSWYVNSSKKENMRYVSSDNGTVYYDMTDITSKEAKLKFVAYLKKDVEITSGKGTERNPYKINN